ncbi:glutaminyl-peptide cyclotransferase [Mangrovimonas aestuarii]|uniref:glutaminyl-peptide cyclotransferase n=1 Tax=Mangrovimonas aestuarii TaxID=3018443 RepID=UPI0023793F2C|nr:glutaminyl-peptide cyclotransferase [Mangrovimonas aestuarii]
MKTINRLSIILLSAITFSCGNSTENKKNDFSIATNAQGNSLTIDETLKVSLNNPKKHEISSVTYTLDGKTISENTPLSNFKLGKHKIEAIVKFDGETQTITHPLLILNTKAPKVLTFETRNIYPHDITSYTQGLEFHNDTLYESTGQYGSSKLRKVNHLTGDVYQNIDLENIYFGEGLTVLNNKLYQLTWQRGRGFVYNPTTLKKESTFNYGNSKEGWGLCNDGKVIYKSDGTEKIWILDPETLAEKSYIQVYTNKGKIGRINEMEWIDGKIYANIYQRDGVAVINPKNGAVEAVIDFSPLKKEITQHPKLDVLNGMAFNHNTNTLFVTGKLWDKLFEVVVTEKQ